MGAVVCRNPLESVSWEAAVNLCEMLLARLHWPVRSLTEAEWGMPAARKARAQAECLGCFAPLPTQIGCRQVKRYRRHCECRLPLDETSGQIRIRKQHATKVASGKWYVASRLAPFLEIA